MTEDLSRVGRDQADLHHFRRSLEFCGVRLRALADGIDTASAHAELAFTMKTAVASPYMRDLRDKTLRGLEGRALAGYATGGVPFGYSLRKQFGPTGKPIGSLAEIDEERAPIVRRIFTLYLEGNSFAAIAKRLNAERVPPPRVHAKNLRTGWKDSTIRAILHNETYTGRWRYKSREWRKLPGTNKRHPRNRPEADVIVQDCPHLRIIDEDTWDAVRKRRQAIASIYTKIKDGKPKSGSISARRTPYLFSGLLHCGACGAKMVIAGGNSSAVYYRCESLVKRGTCSNRLSVRENVVRASLLDELRHRLASPEGFTYARKRSAERLGELDRERESERQAIRPRLEKIERQIQKLIDFITEGNAVGPAAKAVGEQLTALERDAESERKALAVLNGRSPLRQSSCPPGSTAKRRAGLLFKGVLAGGQCRLTAKRSSRKWCSVWRDRRVAAL